MKTINFKVEAKDIENGRRGCPKQCPIAQVLHRKLNIDPMKGSLRVGAGYVHFERDDAPWPLTLITNTVPMQQFIEKFDKSRKLVKPKSFRLRIADEAWRVIKSIQAK